MKKAIYILFFIFISFYCFADDASGFIAPKFAGFEIQENSAIEMTDEVVEIWEDHVKVKFHFTNLTDETQKVTIGFPIEWKKRTGMFADENKPLEDNNVLRKEIESYFNFKSTCNGNPLERKLIASARNNPDEYEDKCDYWFVTELSFNPNQVLEVIDEYNHESSCNSESIGWSSSRWNYILSTGSSWAKVIKKATIIFHSSFEYWSLYDIPYGIWHLDEMSYHRVYFSYEPVSIIYDKAKEESVVTWVLENIEPKKEWIASYDYAGGGVPLYRTDSYSILVNLLWDELIKIPEYKEVLYNKAGNRTINRSRDDIENNVIPKMSAKEFYDDIVVFTYKSAFTEFQPKTKVAATYAQFLINSIYAIHGYKFKDDKWTKIFSRFSWYKPKSSSVSEKDFSIEEQDMINYLKKYR